MKPVVVILPSAGNAGDVGDTLANEPRGASPCEDIQLGTVGTGRNGSPHGPPVPIAQVTFGDDTGVIKSLTLPNVPKVPGGRRRRGGE